MQKGEATSFLDNYDLFATLDECRQDGSSAQYSDSQTFECADFFAKHLSYAKHSMRNTDTGF